MSSSQVVRAPATVPAEKRTAAEKILVTLREISKPEPDAGDLELMLSTVAMGLESGIGPVLDENQATGALDEFVKGLTSWIALHRSDTARQLVVVELPRNRDLAPGVRLSLLDEAIATADAATSPL